MRTANPVGVRLCVLIRCLQIDALRSGRYSGISPHGDEDAAHARTPADHPIYHIINEFSRYADFS